MITTVSDPSNWTVTDDECFVCSHEDDKQVYLKDVDEGELYCPRCYHSPDNGYVASQLEERVPVWRDSQRPVLAGALPWGIESYIEWKPISKTVRKA